MFHDDNDKIVKSSQVPLMKIKTTTVTKKKTTMMITMMTMFQCDRPVVQRVPTSGGGVPAGDNVWLVEDGHRLPYWCCHRSVTQYLSRNTQK